MKYINCFIVVLVLVVFLIGCIDVDNVIKVLFLSGFINIEIIGYNWFGCFENDF